MISYLNWVFINTGRNQSAHMQCTSKDAIFKVFRLPWNYDSSDVALAFPFTNANLQKRLGGNLFGYEISLYIFYQQRLILRYSISTSQAPTFKEIISLTDCLESVTDQSILTGSDWVQLVSIANQSQIFKEQFLRNWVSDILLHHSRTLLTTCFPCKRGIERMQTRLFIFS